jgi:hypothetical protein
MLSSTLSSTLSSALSSRVFLQNISSSLKGGIPPYWRKNMEECVEEKQNLLLNFLHTFLQNFFQNSREEFLHSRLEEM